MKNQSFKVGDILCYKGEEKASYKVTNVNSSGNYDLAFFREKLRGHTDMTKEVVERALELAIPREVIDSPLYKAMNETSSN
jgi:hypothetical protein